MKTVLAMRHAKSSWSDSSVSDQDRPLNGRGLRDAPRMGELLRDEGLVPDAIVTSTAKRALETAHAVAQSSGFTGEFVESPELYGATAATIRAVLHGVDDRVERVAIVCHNPGINRFVTTLVREPVTMKTSAIANVAAPIDAWAELDKHVEGRLVATWRPKDLT